MPIITNPSALQGQTFHVEELTLPAGVWTAIAPPPKFYCSSVTVGNATGADVLLADNAAGTGAGVIADGFERLIILWQPGQGQFRHDAIACWLFSAGGGGVVVWWS